MSAPLATRLLLVALLSLGAGACQSLDDSFGDVFGSNAAEDDGYATMEDDAGADDCTIRRVGDESTANSLVCQ